MVALEIGLVSQQEIKSSRIVNHNRLMLKLYWFDSLWLTELKVFVPFDIKWVISEAIFPANISATTEDWGSIMEFGEATKNPAYRIFQTEYSGCLDISAHA